MTDDRQPERVRRRPARRHRVGEDPCGLPRGGPRVPPSAGLVRGPGDRRRRWRTARHKETRGGSGEPAAWRGIPGRRLEPVPRPRTRRGRPTFIGSRTRPRLDEVVEVHADPAGLDPLAAARDLALRCVRGSRCRSRAGDGRTGRGGAARLDPEQVRQHGHDEVAVEVPPIVADREQHDRQPRRAGCRGSPSRARPSQAAIGRWMKSSRAPDRLDPTASLSANTRPARIDYDGQHDLLSSAGLVEVDVLERVDVGDGPAAGLSSGRGCGTAPARGATTPSGSGPPMNL